MQSHSNHDADFAAVPQPEAFPQIHGGNNLQFILRIAWDLRHDECATQVFYFRLDQNSRAVAFFRLNLKFLRFL